MQFGASGGRLRRNRLRIGASAERPNGELIQWGAIEHENDGDIADRPFDGGLR
jgi:hypothetical protein